MEDGEILRETIGQTMEAKQERKQLKDFMDKIRGFSAKNFTNPACPTCAYQDNSKGNVELNADGSPKPNKWQNMQFESYKIRAVEQLKGQPTINGVQVKFKCKANDTHSWSMVLDPYMIREKAKDMKKLGFELSKLQYELHFDKFNLEEPSKNKA